jgi:hypothetical protein
VEWNGFEKEKWYHVVAVYDYNADTGILYVGKRPHLV